MNGLYCSRRTGSLLLGMAAVEDVLSTGSDALLLLFRDRLESGILLRWLILRFLNMVDV